MSVERIPQSVTKRFLLKAYLASDHVTAATGKTIAVVISQNGAAFGNPSAGATNATEVGSGWYYFDASTTDTGTAGPLIVRGTASGVDDVERTYHVVNAHNAGFDGVPAAAAEASGGLATLSAAQASNGTINANVHRWLTGTPNALQSGRIDSYLGAVASGVIAAASLAADVFTTIWSAASRTLTAGTNIVLAKGTGITGFTDLDAAGVRTAVGLASASVDTQFAGLKTNTDLIPAVPAATAAAVSADHGTGSYQRNTEPLDAAAMRAAIGLAGANLDAQLTALATIAAADPGGVTTLLERLTSARAALLDNLSRLDATISSVIGAIPSAAGNADGLLDAADAVETDLTVRQALRLVAAAAVGKVSGMEDNAPVFRNVGDTKDRITATTDDDGNRVTVIVDAA